MRDGCARFFGAIAALPTPFAGGGVDTAGLQALVAWQIDEGINGLVACGTTGEAATLTLAERLHVIQTCVHAAAGRVPVIAGTGSNCTRETIHATLAAAECGADAALVVTPCYNKPSQEGLYQHFAAVAAAAPLPIILYNVPGRTGVDLLPVTVERLSRLPGIIGLKDATGDLARPQRTAKLAGRDFLQFSGHDATALGFALAGGAGAISVVANLAPRLTAQMHHACRIGNLHAARIIQRRLTPLIEALERETNPVPLKYALQCLRGLSAEVRLPLWGVTAETGRAVREAVGRVCGEGVVSQLTFD